LRPSTGGDYNPIGGVLRATAEDYEAVSGALKEAFTRGGLDEASRRLQENLEGDPYTLKAIFRDEQQRILNRIMESEWGEAEAAFANLYPHLMSLLRIMAKTGGSATIPRAFHAAAEFVLNTRLRRALGSEQLDFEGIRGLIGDAEGAQVALDVPTLEYTLRMRLERMAKAFQADPVNVELLRGLDTAVEMARSLPVEVNLWKIQNICYDLLRTTYADLQKGEARKGEGQNGEAPKGEEQKSEEPKREEQKGEGQKGEAPKGAEGGQDAGQNADQNASQWLPLFRALAEKLSLRVDAEAPLVPATGL